MKIVKGKQAGPRRILLYGQHGVGKSTWASEAPNPIFLNIEDGLADIDCDKTEKLKDIGAINASLSWLISEPHDYQTVVVDSADWFDILLHNQVAGEFGKQSYEEIKYGEGAGRIEKGWQWLLNNLDCLLTHRRMSVIILAHAKIEKFNDPLLASYDRYVPDLSKQAFGYVQEWAQEVLFARFRVFTSETKEAFGSKRNTAIGGKDRYILTNEAGASMAKNRLQLPDELPMSWADYYAYWPKSEPAATPATVIPAQVGNIAGIVVDGSSKVLA